MMEELTAKRQTQLVVVVPAFNEEAKIEDTIAGLNGVKKEFLSAGVLLRVVVVNDGSEDQTAALALKAGCDMLCTHKINQGLGAAVRTGLLAARRCGADIAVKFDADCQHDPRDIIRLIQPILDDQADVVYGNRFEKIEYTMPLIRRVGNKVFTKLMAMLTGWPLQDSQPGILAVNRNYLQVFHLPGDYNYTQQILLDAFHKGMRFGHVPVRFRKRTTGRSFVSFKYPCKVLPQLVMVLISVKPLKMFMPIGLVFILLAGLIFSAELVQWFSGAAEKPVVHVNLVLGSAMFGLQTLFFGLLAELIVRLHYRDYTGTHLTITERGAYDYEVNEAMINDTYKDQTLKAKAHG